MQSDSRDIERAFHTAAWMWAGYLISLAMVDLVIYAGGPIEPIAWYYCVNGIPAVIFLGLSYSKWLMARARWLTPLMILLISIAPVLLNHLFDLRLPPAPLSNIEGMVLRQLPVLFIGLVLVAWHYKLTTMLLYSVATNIAEFWIVNLLGVYGDQRQYTFYFIVIIRTVSFVVAGVFINQLVTRLRAQQASLEAANRHLAHYASTLENLAVSRERNRLARELHDTLAHTLSGLSVQLETVKAYWDVDPDMARRLLSQSLAATRSGLDETRRSLKALRASPLEDLGLLLAVRKLAESAGERGKLELSLALPDRIASLAPDVEQCVYRVAQESLENVVRHANAKTLAVRLAVDAAGISLAVEDDGSGLDVEQAWRAGHYGLAGMRERAQLVGGQLAVSSRPCQGTRVQLSIEGFRHD
jgi:signal transduction histidine kinase